MPVSHNYIRINGQLNQSTVQPTQKGYIKYCAVTAASFVSIYISRNYNVYHSHQLKRMNSGHFTVQQTVISHFEENRDSNECIQMWSRPKHLCLMILHVRGERFTCN